MTNMRKIYLLGLALLGVCAFGAVSAVGAFAAGPEWLVEGNPVPAGGIAAETEGTFVLTKFEGANSNSVLNKFTCEAVFDGFSDPAGAGEITKVLNLKMEDVGNNSLTALSGIGLLEDCKVTETKGTLTDCVLNPVETMLVWPDNLPWISQLELMENAAKEVIVLDKITAATAGDMPGYEFECETPLGNLSELCEGNSSFFITNDALTPMGVIGTPDSTEKISCTITGEKSGTFEGAGGTTHAIGAELVWLDTLVDHEGFVL